MLETIADYRNPAQAFEAIASDPRYAHFTNIPGRIIRCLDHFHIACDRVEVKRRLRAYYLFIGVVDEAIDSGRLDVGTEVLNRFSKRVPCFDDRTQASRVGMVTEFLKRDLKDDAYHKALTKLHELYGAVVMERKAETIAAYIEQRRVVGRLTAELSYVLIRSFLEDNSQDFLGFLERIGAVGCLVDSVIDLRADTRLGLVSFQPTIGDFVKLLTSTVREGLSVSMKHPALLGVFLEAVSDNVRDRCRTGSKPEPRSIAPLGKEGVPSVV